MREYVNVDFIGEMKIPGMYNLSDLCSSRLTVLRILSGADKKVLCRTTLNFYERVLVLGLARDCFGNRLFSYEMGRRM